MGDRRDPLPPFHGRQPVYTENVVATSQPLAAQAGLTLIKSGGNAVDAALAAAIALTVVEPTGNGIGGDAFAMVWDGHRLHGLNGSGRAPAAWTPERFAGRTAMPELGWDTVTVPGAVSAWVALSERFGRLPFADLFQPAIHYARKGFPVSPTVAGQWAAAPDRYRGYREFGSAFLIDGRAPRAGERFSCPDLAASLEQIAETRGAAFYRGRLAQKIADHAEETGGCLTLVDLAAHSADWVSPIAQDYGGVRIHELPPNGQGLAALIALGILRHLDGARYPVDSADGIHLQVEAMKMAFEDAFRHIADDDFVDLRPRLLLDEKRLAEKAAQIRLDRARQPAAGVSPDRGTVYLAAGDADGMMVSLIQSNYLGFGSGIVVPGTGISLQNRGRGFSLAPGHPNRVGPGKRPFHTIIPAFATHNGRPVMSFGVMGAHMQPQGHVQMVSKIFDHGFDPQRALEAPRWYVHEDFSLAFEGGIPGHVIDALQQRGHRLMADPQPWIFGAGQIVFRLESGYCAASDPRKDGQAVGF